MFGFDPDKSWVSLVFSLIILPLGVLPLLSKYGVISFSVSFLTSSIVKFATYILAGGALFIIIDAFMEDLTESNAVVTIFIGLILLIIGILPIVGVSIPFINSILTPTVYYFLFSFEGLVLFIGSFFMG